MIAPILIGFNKYEVKFLEVIDDDHEMDGQTCTDEKIIKIRKDSNAFMAATLLHEIYHAMHHEILNTRTGEVPISVTTYRTEEELTTKDSLALSIVIRDNPKAFRWIVNNMGKF